VQAIAIKTIIVSTMKRFFISHSSNI